MARGFHNFFKFRSVSIDRKVTPGSIGWRADREPLFDRDALRRFYLNSAVARIQEITEFNIGHNIISRAVLVGLERAVREMREAISAT